MKAAPSARFERCFTFPGRKHHAVPLAARVSGMPAHNSSNPHNLTRARPSTASLAPNAPAEVPVKNVLSDAPTEIATPSAPSVRLKQPVRRLRSAATTVIVTPKMAPQTAFATAVFWTEALY